MQKEPHLLDKLESTKTGKNQIGLLTYMFESKT